MVMSDVEELLVVRQQQYGNAWKITGQLIDKLGTPALGALIFSEYLFAWIQILNKLVRILANPVEKDHWIDIAGYATLVIKDIEKTNAATSDRDKGGYTLTPVRHSGGDNV